MVEHLDGGPNFNPVPGSKRTETGYVPGETIYTGDHVVSSSIAWITREWRPDDKAAQRFKDDVIRRVEQLFNNTSTGTGGGEDEEAGGGGTSPDLFFDTGYFWLTSKNYVPNNDTHVVKHNLGQIPSRFSIFFCNKQNPDFDPLNPVIIASPTVIVDDLTPDTYAGFWVTFDTKNTLKFWGAKNKVIHSGSEAPQAGYFRMLMWK